MGVAFDPAAQKVRGGRGRTGGFNSPLAVPPGMSTATKIVVATVLVSAVLAVGIIVNTALLA